MTPNKDQLTLVVEFYRKCNPLGPPSDGEIVLELCQVGGEALAQTLIGMDLLQPLPDDASKFVLIKIPNFFWDVDDFLLKPERRFKPPRKFYVASQDWLSDESPSHELQLKYKRAIRLLELLREVSAHEDTAGNDLKLVILHKEKLVVGSEYNLLEMQELDGLEEFDKEYVNSDTHQEKKRDILKTVLVEMYSGKKSIQVGRLIDDFNEILSRLSHGYDLFVHDFSFSKIKSEVERDKLEFTTRLNKVFSDIQNQLLAVPAALLLVGSQMEKPELAELQLGNLAIWLGAVIFFVLMELLIRNQRNTLQAVKGEVDLQRTIFKEDHVAVYGKFKNIYRELDDRFNHQCKLLWFLRGLVGAVLGFTTGMLVWYSSGTAGYAFIAAIILTIFPILLALLINDFFQKTKSDD
ncbi:hypothetical protein HOP60_15745 [Halomonas daqingensis]|uniref:Uncharacterized protein n=1 Tax=Billgrantia desiderata TaxID=52021 RepID=A0ABS9B7J3_9GAMM|nr:hypothetical protein [Halomonas desiderata]MCE8043608.1 hypothetical protein [Halomonas desiderata]MCE8048182.1 hypothetical protein [Halomonas desiderata]